ncbi:RNA polymerase sigma factor SigE [Dietzia timorensis]|uniref:RNA polymerase sigma factor SigE n=1 Tax=Dietzia timorensis TaxID=499555 RepID=UPI000829E501|nr:RNA polymerase sigma factor SigE [Dietzia timorensis]
MGAVHEGDAGSAAEIEAATAAFDRSGDKADLPSWNRIVADHGDRVYRLAFRLTGNAQDAEDLTQDAFIRVFKSLDRYKPGTFEGWMHRIVTNLFLDQVRRKARIRMDALPEDQERLPSGHSGPEQVVVGETFDPVLQRALDNLPPDYRAAVVLCDIEDLTYEQVGRILGIKMGTVRSRIHRGRAALRAELAAGGVNSMAEALGGN